MASLVPWLGVGQKKRDDNLLNSLSNFDVRTNNAATRQYQTTANAPTAGTAAAARAPMNNAGVQENTLRTLNNLDVRSNNATINPIKTLSQFDSTMSKLHKQNGGELDSNGKMSFDDFRATMSAKSAIENGGAGTPFKPNIIKNAESIIKANKDFDERNQNQQINKNDFTRGLKDFTTNAERNYDSENKLKLDRPAMTSLRDVEDNGDAYNDRHKANQSLAAASFRSVLGDSYKNDDYTRKISYRNLLDSYNNASGDQQADVKKNIADTIVTLREKAKQSSGNEQGELLKSVNYLSDLNSLINQYGEDKGKSFGRQVGDWLSTGGILGDVGGDAVEQLLGNVTGTSGKIKADIEKRQNARQDLGAVGVANTALGAVGNFASNVVTGGAAGAANAGVGALNTMMGMNDRVLDYDENGNSYLRKKNQSEMAGELGNTALNVAFAAAGAKGIGPALGTTGVNTATGLAKLSAKDLAKYAAQELPWAAGTTYLQEGLGNLAQNKDWNDMDAGSFAKNLVGNLAQDVGMDVANYNAGKASQRNNTPINDTNLTQRLKVANDDATVRQNEVIPERQPEATVRPEVESNRVRYNDEGAAVKVNEDGTANRLSNSELARVANNGTNGTRINQDSYSRTVEPEYTVRTDNDSNLRTLKDTEITGNKNISKTELTRLIERSNAGDPEATRILEEYGYKPAETAQNEGWQRKTVDEVINPEKVREEAIENARENVNPALRQQETLDEQARSLEKVLKTPAEIADEQRIAETSFEKLAPNEQAKWLEIHDKDVMSEAQLRETLRDMDIDPTGMSRLDMLRVYTEATNAPKVRVESDDTTRLYRGLTQEYDPNYPVSKLDTSGYESWTDSPELARQYGDYVYYVDVPTDMIKNSYLDENPNSPTYGDRNTVFLTDKKAGLNGISGKEYQILVGNEDGLQYRPLTEGSVKDEGLQSKFYKSTPERQAAISSITENKYLKDINSDDPNKAWKYPAKSMDDNELQQFRKIANKEFLNKDEVMNMTKVKEAEEWVNNHKPMIPEDYPDLVQQVKREFKEKILAEAEARGGAKKEHKAFFVTGLPGAGKSSTGLNEYLDNGYIEFDNDIAKTVPALKEYYNEGLGAGTIQKIVKAAQNELWSELAKEGYNIAYPMVGKEVDDIKIPALLLKDNGYNIDDPDSFAVAFVPATQELSMTRATQRFYQDGRYVSPTYIESVGLTPQTTYATIKEKGIQDARDQTIHRIRIDEYASAPKGGDSHRLDQAEGLGQARGQMGGGRDLGYLEEARESGAILSRGDGSSGRGHVSPQSRDEYSNSVLRSERLETASQNTSGFAKNTSRNTNFSEETRQALKNDPINYKAATNEERLARANEILSTKKSDEIDNYLRENLFSVNPKKADSSDMVLAGEYAKMLDAKGQYDRSTEIINKMSEIGTKQGQNIQALSLMMNRSPEGIANMAQSAIKKSGGEMTGEIRKEIVKRTQEIGKTRGERAQLEARNKVISEQIMSGKGDLQALRQEQVQIAQAFRKSLDQEGRQFSQLSNTVSKNSPDNRSVFGSVWRASLLSGPRTHTGNAVSNTFQNVLNAGADRVASGLDWARAKITGTERQVVSSAGGRGKGLKRGLKAAGEVLKTGDNLWDSTDVIANKSNTWGQGGELEFKNRIANTMVAKPTNFVFRAMSAGDLPFRYSAFENAIRTEAKRQGINQGYRGQALQDYINSRVAAPDPELQAYGIRKGNEAVYDVDTKLSGIMNRVDKFIDSQENKLVKSGLRTAKTLVAPFVKVPSKVLSTAIDYSPLGSVKAIVNKVGSPNYTTGQFETDIAKSGLGTAGFVGLGYALSAAGLLTGSYPESQDERNRWKAEGIEPNSIKIGDTYLSLNYLGPASMLMSMGSGVQQRQAKGEDPLSVATGTVMDTLNTFLDQSYVQGLSNALQAITDSQRYGESYVNSFARGLVPNLLRQTATATDPMQRQTNGVGDAVISGIPGLSQTLDAKQDTYGRDIENKQTLPLGQMWDALKLSNARETTDVIDEVSRLHAVDPSNKDLQITPPIQGKSVSVDGQNIELTSSQRTQLQKDVGEAATAAMQQVMRSSQYASLTDEQKADALSKARQNAQTQARKQFIEANGITADNNPGTTNSGGSVNNNYADKAISNATSTRENGAITINDKLTDEYKNILNKYNSMDKEAWDKFIYGDSLESANAEYNLAKAKYENDLANGDVSDTEKVKREKELAKLEATKNYTKDVRDAYSLASNKSDIQKFLSGIDDEDKKSKLIGALNGLNNTLYNAGLITKSTYNSRGRNINNLASSSSKKSSRSRSGSKSSSTGISSEEASAMKAMIKAAAKTDTSSYKVKVTDAPNTKRQMQKAKQSSYSLKTYTPKKATITVSKGNKANNKKGR